MAEVRIEIDIDANGRITLTPNPARVADGDTVVWHVNSNQKPVKSVTVTLPAGADSPFGNTNEAAVATVENPRRCNELAPSSEPANWPPGVRRYRYRVTTTGSPEIDSADGTLEKSEEYEQAEQYQ